MLSSSALKYKIKVSSSYYAGAIVFLLYLLVILLSLSIVSLTFITLCIYLLLLLVAAYAAKKAYLQQYEFLLSESGLVERREGDKRYSGKISRSSFYNGLFISLHLEEKETSFAKKSKKQFITIYKDAISEEQYRLLAQLINSERA